MEPAPAAIRLTHFHSKDFWHSKKEFKGWNEAQKLAFTHKAIAITDRHTVFASPSL